VRKFLRAGVVALAAATAAVVVGAAWAGTEADSVKVIPFAAAYAGTATTKVTDDVVDIVANGVGAGIPIGKGRITGKGKGLKQEPCVPFTGPGSMTGTKGNINFMVVPGSEGCGGEGDSVSIVGRAKVTKGTKLFLRAKGTLKFTGVYDSAAGTFKVKFTGKLTA
jgi:hypothetical protein